jgi:hypothetical protein
VKLDFDFDRETFTEGEAAFMRGVSIAQLVEQIRRTIKDPNAGIDGSDAQLTRWSAEQAKRQEAGAGLALGYLNGLAQAIRRVDSQMQGGTFS